MKKGFTIVEVSILFVIFLIVALLVAPLSLDDTKQAQLISKWRNVQQDFLNIFYAVNSQKEENNESFQSIFESYINNEVKNKSESYKIIYRNGNLPNPTYKFDNYMQTNADATIAYKFFEQNESGKLGIIMYDVNGKIGPNTWGKDVFGFNIYDNKLEPLGKSELVSIQKQDCSRSGSGVYCSNYYLIGGSFD